jgi:hypothetical protein
MQNNISFTSNINFVSPRQFRKVIRRHGEYIPFENYGEGKFCSISQNFYTECIRTCSAGGIKSSESAVGFHVKDSYTNYEKIKKVYKSIKSHLIGEAEGGLLIGSKNLIFAPYSKKIFNVLKNMISQDTKSLSVFETFTDRQAEAHIHYSLPNDTWTINAQIYDPKNEKYYSINNKEDLIKSFEKIVISENDKLFIQGKEIKL